MKDLKKYNLDASYPKRPVYEKRYKKNGEEYLKIVEEIDIEEDMKEKQLEINRIKELIDNKERLKAQELLDNLTNEEWLEELNELSKINEIDTYEFLNRIEEIKSVYNKMPEDVRMKYKNLSKFTKEYLPNFIEEQSKKIETMKKEEKEEIITNETENLKAEIENLKKQLENKGETDNV